MSEQVPSDSREDELDDQYPDRPQNRQKALPFRDLYLTLFNPLNDNKKQPTGPAVARRKIGPRNGAPTKNPHVLRQNIIERFISRWRQEVGEDIYPAFRLIIPDKDRERPMYGLKESIIGKILIQVMKINKDSEDGQSLKNWKQPGNTPSSRMAGDFAGRCFEVISKRPMRTQPGDMTIDEVNDLLDRLASANKLDAQEKIFEIFYSKMNPEELMWLIRIVLRQMKVGASEKTIFEIFHPDAHALFNICSNLRRVCWELHDPQTRLEGDDTGVSLMSCFQPQLAQFQMRDFKKMVARMHPTEEDPVFWVEEKLDGERMQLHMISDPETPGGKRFGFWSRKAKDYTSMYGSGFEDDQSSLTRFIKDAFVPGVENIILDGEMITWDPKEDLMVPFGSLKTAAKFQQDNPYSGAWRPLYRIFDILYLNGQDITKYTLRDRRAALKQAVKDVHRRIEIHSVTEATQASEIDPMLRKIVAEASEGLVLKNPRSAYRLNQRNDDWIKVKPEYMNEFGENLDCTIIAGYYGSGRRGGALSSFLCGLRVDDNQTSQATSPVKFYSFFKVGGGFSGPDLAALRQRTEGKWKKWDPKKPPIDYIVLATDGRRFIEQPDEWIMPNDSVVVEVKAASVAASDSFKMGFTLRFPRFKRMREDKTWQTSLSISEFMTLRKEAEGERKDKEFQMEELKRKKPRLSKKKSIKIAGSGDIQGLPVPPSEQKMFAGLNFYIMTPSQKPNKRTKNELQELVKSHGGNVFQNYTRPDTICVADNRSVQVASAIKHGDTDIIRPVWIFDNVRQAEADGDRASLLLRYEPHHVFFARAENETAAGLHVDEFGDSFARDVTIGELESMLQSMPAPREQAISTQDLWRQVAQESEITSIKGWLFNNCRLYLDLNDGESTKLRQARYLAEFAGATVDDGLQDGISHVVTCGTDSTRIKSLREQISELKGLLPRLVTPAWIEESWKAGSMLDEEQFAPGPK